MFAWLLEFGHDDQHHEVRDRANVKSVAATHRGPQRKQEELHPHPHPHGNVNGHVRLRAPGDDDIEWAPDAQAFVSPPAIPPEEIGPHGEIPGYAPEAFS
jgi:hypothetical protein